MGRLVQLAEALILIPIIALLGMIGYMAVDRDPPGVPGKVIEAYIDEPNLLLEYEFLRRRACDVSIYRQLVRDGLVTTLVPMQVPAGQIIKMEDQTPSRVKQVLPLLPNPVGPTTLRVTLDYVCNPLQKLWPLRVEYELHFTPTVRYVRP